MKTAGVAPATLARLARHGPILERVAHGVYHLTGAPLSTMWVKFYVDLVGSDLRMTGEPEPTLPLARVVMPDDEQHGYGVYSLVDHIADKVVAIFQLYGEQRRPSTRYKDLVDLVSIATGASVAAGSQLTPLASEAERPGVVQPSVRRRALLSQTPMPGRRCIAVPRTGDEGPDDRLA